MDNQFFWIQTDGTHPVAKITAMEPYDPSEPNAHANDSTWILVAMIASEVSAFQDNWQECGYNFDAKGVETPKKFALDASVPQGSGVVATIYKRLDALEGNNTYQNSDDSSIYGVAWNRGAGNTLNNGMKRIDDAVGMTSSTSGHDDFDNAGPYQFQRVHNQFGDFMRIPRVYIKKTKTGSVNNGQVTWEVSCNRFPGSYLPKCFVHYDSNGMPIGVNDYVDVGCYDASLSGNNLVSVTGQAPLVNLGIDGFRQDARNDGQGFQVLDVHVWDVLRTLFVIEFATLQSDSVFHGYRGGNNPVASGFTDSISAPTGEASNHTFKWRGIENLYSNIGQWCDGINFDLPTGTKIYVCDDANQYQSQDYAYPYQLVGYTWHWGNAQDEGLDKAHPEVNINENGDSGTNHSYYCDWQGGGAGHTVAYVGNPWDGTNYGIFYLSVGTPSTAWPGSGSRLVRKQY